MPLTETGYTEIGAFEAKAKLSEILRKVEQGERFTITRRGRAVAEIVPARAYSRARAAEAARNLLAMPKVEGVSAETIKKWIEEGRE